MPDVQNVICLRSPFPSSALPARRRPRPPARLPPGLARLNAQRPPRLQPPRLACQLDRPTPTPTPAWPTICTVARLAPGASTPSTGYRRLLVRPARPLVARPSIDACPRPADAPAWPFTDSTDRQNRSTVMADNHCTRQCGVHPQSTVGKR